MTDLHLAPALALPADAVTAAIGVLGVRGSGKTTTAAVLVEELVGAGSQTVVIDPLDAWHGLRSDAEGTGPGLPVVVFGGDSGDLPLEAGMAHPLADLVVDEGVSVVLSLRHLSKTKQRSFVADFAERLYHRKGESHHRSPLHVVVDEADSFVPQRVAGDVARAMGAIDDLVRRGRSSGFGVTLITQRAAAINKDVLSQIDLLIAHKTVSPQDRKALEAWIDAHDSEGRKEEFMRTLAALAVGEAWVWSPAWLDVFARVRIRPRWTFDSSATPKPGQVRIEPTAAATVDLEQLRERLAASLERAEAEDPAAMRRQLETYTAKLRKADDAFAELQRRLEERIPEPFEVRIEVPVLDDATLARLDASCERMEVGIRELRATVADVAEIALAARPQPSPVTPAKTDDVVIEDRLAGPPITVLRDDVRRMRPLVASPTTGPRQEAVTATGLKAGERRILEVLARHHPMKVTKAQLGTLAELTMSGGAATAYYQRLRSEGWVSQSGDLIDITPGGFWAIGRDVPDTPATPERVRDVWLNALPPRPAEMLRILIDTYPTWRTREQLAGAMGMTATGGAFGGYLTVLRQNDLIEQQGGQAYQASDWLFGEGRP